MAKKKIIKVFIIKSQRNKGQKIIKTKEFPSKELANIFIQKYNLKNDSNYERTKEIPEIYTFARLKENWYE